MSIEEKFFEVFEIEPWIVKGEYYMTTDCRVAEVQAEKDIPWAINSDMILKLEDILPSFELKIEPAPADEKMYCYSSRGNIGKYEIDRETALLSFFIEHKDLYKDRIQSLFSHPRRFKSVFEVPEYTIKN